MATTGHSASKDGYRETTDVPTGRNRPSTVIRLINDSMTVIRVEQSGRAETDFVDIHVVTLLDGECLQPNLPHYVGSNLSMQRSNPIPKESFKLPAC